MCGRNGASSRSARGLFSLLKHVAAIFAATAISAVALEKPNILIILADDMGYSDLGCYGSGIETPNLDRLASNGLRFSRFYNTGRCCPSRASLLTGLYAHQAGVGHMLGKTRFPGYSDGLNPEVPTLSEVLKTNGYHTFMSGKWHPGWGDESSPNRRGFDRSYGSRGYVDSYFTVVPGTDIYLDNEIINPAGKPAKNHLHPDREFYTTDTYTDYALHFIDEHRAKHPEQPFFGYLAYNAPHFPLHAKPEDTAKYQGRFLEKGWDPVRQSRLEKLKAAGLISEDTTLPERDSPDWSSLNESRRKDLDFTFALYCAIIDRLDQNVGRVVEHLREHKILDSTLIIFMSDNGSTKEREMFGMGPGQTLANYDTWGRKGGWTSSIGKAWANVANTPFRRYKREAYEGGTASPAIIWAGEKVSPHPAHGSQTDQVAHIIDILPTLAELGGADLPTKLEGKSLVPVIGGKTIGPRTLYWEHEGHRAILDDEWKLVASSAQAWELYHLSEDRSETINLLAKDPDRATMLESKWNTWSERVGVQPWSDVLADMKARRKKK